MAEARKALPPLLVVLVGALLAYLMLVSSPLWVLAALLGLVAGWFAGKQGRARTADDPVSSLAWFEWSQVLPYSIAVAVSALLIFLAVWLAWPATPEVPAGAPKPPTNPLDPYLKELLKAVAGGVSAFLAAAFVKPSDDSDGLVATQVKASFKDAFKSKFGTHPQVERAVLAEDFENAGWDADGRLKRASAIARALDLPKGETG